MAAKKETVKTIKAVRDDATAKEAMKVVGKSLADVNKAIDGYAAVSEGKAQRGMCAAMYAWGLGIKATGKAAFDEKLYIDRINAYFTSHWAEHEMPGEPTLRGYRSQYRAFAEMAWAKYDAKGVVGECLAIANVQMPWRAARMRDALKLDAKPSDKALGTLLRITAAAGTVTVREGSSVLLSLVNVLVDAAKHKGLHDVLDADKAAAKWLRPALAGAVAYRTTEASKMSAGKKRTAYEQSIAAARAVLDKRPNVAAVGRA